MLKTPPTAEPAVEPGRLDGDRLLTDDDLTGLTALALGNDRDRLLDGGLETDRGDEASLVGALERFAALGLCGDGLFVRTLTDEVFRAGVPSASESEAAGGFGVEAFGLFGESTSDGGGACGATAGAAEGGATTDGGGAAAAASATGGGDGAETAEAG